MKELFSQWEELVDGFRKNKILSLFFDYDGTLTPIVEKPQSAKLSLSTRRLLEQLRGLDCFKVAIISGRSLPELKRLVGIGGIIYAGNHGMELEGPKLRFINPTARYLKIPIEKINRSLCKVVKNYKGVIVENKGLTLSIHYRLVKNERTVDKIFKVLNDIIRSYKYRKIIKVTHGKKVFEIRPNIRWDKGRIIQWLIARYRFVHKNSTILPIYLGDDLTDEDAFKALGNNGITVFVGNPKSDSHARFYLENIVSVREFLRRLIELRKQHAKPN